MKSLEMAKATDSLATYARKARKETVILTEHGRPVYALVPIKNTDGETAALSTDPVFLSLIERSRKHTKAEGGIPASEMRKRFSKDTVKQPSSKSSSVANSKRD